MISTETLRRRQKNLLEAMAAAGLDGLALNASPSLVYMTGLHFHVSERPVVALFTPKGVPTLVLPEFEKGKTESMDFELKTFTYNEKLSTWAEAFEQGAQAAGLRGSGGKVGVEDGHFRIMEMRLLERALPEADLTNAEEMVAELRMYKDDEEIAAMQEAVHVAQKALVATLPLIKIGMTELELAGELTAQLLRHGSHPTMPFAPIVATGPNSANPHAVPSERKLTAGDLLIVDWGASVDDYFSDLTRTFAVGEVDEESAKIHKIVQDANAAGRAAAKPGVACGAVDKAARDVIEAEGYGKYFIHRTGHGLGMEGHEHPYIRGDNRMALKPGMTFTIEPGIYLPNKTGVRVEDNVVVTKDGLRSLSNLPREMRAVG